MSDATAKNLRILHQGMGWPVGEIVPPTALPHGYAGHLALGAVEETDAPVTAGVSAPAAPKIGDDLVAANQELRGVIAELDGKLAGVNAELKAVKAELDKVKAENASLWAEAEAREQTERMKKADEDRRKHAAGPQPVVPPVAQPRMGR